MLRRVRIRVPDGWPGIVGIVVLLVGMAGVLGRPGVTPFPVPATDVGGYLPAFAYGSGSEPDDPIDTEAASSAHEASDELYAGLGDSGYADRHQSIVALFDGAGSAALAVDELDLPNGTTALLIDRMVLLIGLANDAAAAELTGPLQDAAQLLIEGDRGGEGSIVLDLRCTAPSEDAASRVAQALGDYGAVPYYANLRPPWHGAPLTPDEELARATYRRWTQAYADTLRSDPYFADWGTRFIATESATERAALQEELNRHVLERSPTLGGDAHPGVVAILASRPEDGDPDGYVEWGLALGRLMGPVSISEGSDTPSWFDQRHGGSIGSVRAVQRAVEVGWASFNTFALGATGLFAYLHDHGCTDVRITLSDLDDVRGD